MARDYAIYDVFTSKALAGNPLAVVFDGAGLTDDAMQAIAREFNLSETVFVQPAENAAHTARIRIFTPGRELPFAGHPTVGTAIALAERSNASRGLDVVSVLEENVGPVRCLVRVAPGQVSFAEFDLPRKSEQLAADVDVQNVADALCISAADIGFENHTLSVWSAGVPFLMVPVRDMGIASTLTFDAGLWQKRVGKSLSAYVYCRGGADHRASFHARMFAPDMGIAEDPATGGAVAAMSGAIRHFDALADGHHALLIEQGVEMGRPSHIDLHIEVESAEISRARIGGEAVRVASGKLYL
ncbi:PhzF family phenazine biosynthesis protein [Rhizobium sp. KVB221]|uniref:PhzF family phenazine biosynthesis protein n=1 Tax=Rhizobium setariae TaxID=2801340 RepID=A0A936YPF4_9HYPH|nr:PhzF family phenazine biosynthesis protein [Rhizobium setariae]MBL0374369.1 PhzF family phenazine biosynthesis protein [Rhizobium setariae]